MTSSVRHVRLPIAFILCPLTAPSHGNSRAVNLTSIMQKYISLSLFLTISTLPLIISYYLKKRYRNLSERLENVDDNSYYQCIFFDYKNFDCRPHLINKDECGETCSYSQLARLMKFIGSAKTSISMCMYMMTLKQISSELANASRRGVKVRVIMDKGMSQTTPSQSNLKYFDKWRVQYKMPHTSDVMMHNKYCLIDEYEPGSAKMFFGSLNLTTQGLCKNFEAVILTNNADWIERFSQNFEELWNGL